MLEDVPMRQSPDDDALLRHHPGGRRIIYG